MMIVAFSRGFTISVRKIIFLTSIYLFGCALVYLLGLIGSGMVYLFAACIFGILIYPTQNTYWPAWINACICFFFGLSLQLQLIPWPPNNPHSMGVWITISSNLVFLSFLSAALIPHLFNGLQATINKEKKLSIELEKEQASLQAALYKLAEKNKELEHFAYIASHDLKEPLRMVTTFIGMLKNKYSSELDEKAQGYIGFAIDGAKRMQLMIDDLLELSHATRNNTDKESINLSTLLVEVKKNIHDQIKESNAVISTITPLPVIKTYRMDMIRLLQNLLSNAIKFRKKDTPPSIRINAVEKEAEWVFSVQDNGIGIEEAYHEKIFNIFTRLHSQESYEGTGIGLAICKKIVESFGGNIWVESKQGEGTAFFFTVSKTNE